MISSVKNKFTDSKSHCFLCLPRDTDMIYIGLLRCMSACVDSCQSAQIHDGLCCYTFKGMEWEFLIFKVDGRYKFLVFVQNS